MGLLRSARKRLRKSRRLSSHIACLSRDSMPPPPHERDALAAWIERELPYIPIPDASTLDALQSGNGAPLFAYLVHRVVAPSRAELLRAHADLTHKSGALDEDEAEIERLQLEVGKLETETKALRAALRAKHSSFVDASDLRCALVDAAVEQLDERAQTADELRALPDVLRGPPKAHAVDALDAVVCDARAALRPRVDDDLDDDARERVASLDAQLDALCTTYPLDSVAAAVATLASTSGAAPAYEEKEVEDVEQFSTRVRTHLQDTFLTLFASKPEPPPPPAQKRLNFDDDHPHLDDLDDALSRLTGGARARLARLLRDARRHDSALPALQTRLRDAAGAARAALSADLAALQVAQAADLVALVRPSRSLCADKALLAALAEDVRNFQLDAQRDFESQNAHDIARRAQRERDARAKLDARAAKHLVPALEDAYAAATHAADRTVPAARAEVSTAARVGAFVAARAREGT